MARWLVAVLFGGLVGTLALAQATSPCVGEPDPVRRLACYDREHGRAPAPAPEPEALRPANPGAAPAGAGGISAVAPSGPLPTSLGRSRLSEAWDLDAPSGSLFAPRAYRPVYILPATLTDRVNRRPSSPAPNHTVPFDLALQPIEAKYQLSLKAKFGDRLLGTPISLWGGYTQSSRWQLYNGAASRPFRETNYEPELIAVMPMHMALLGWQWRLSAVSLTHQSNGRALPVSRSWNRVIATLALERGDWLLELRPWFRIGEDPADDDNPDIADHVGRGELRLSRAHGDHAFQLQLRHSLRTGDRSRGSVQVEWVFPLTGALHGYLQVFSGHGESLIDYNFRQTRWGLGVTIAGWR